MNKPIIICYIIVGCLFAFGVYDINYIEKSNEQTKITVYVLMGVIVAMSLGIQWFIGAEGICGIGGNGWNFLKWNQREKERDKAFDRLMVLLSCPEEKEPGGFPKEIL